MAIDRRHCASHSTVFTVIIVMADIGARKAMRPETNFETGPSPNDDGVESDCFSILNERETRERWVRSDGA